MTVNLVPVNLVLALYALVPMVDREVEEEEGRLAVTMMDREVGEEGGGRLGSKSRRGMYSHQCSHTCVVRPV